MEKQSPRIVVNRVSCPAWRSVSAKYYAPQGGAANGGRHAMEQRTQDLTIQETL